MSQPTTQLYIFYTCDEHKTRKSFNAKFTFTDGADKNVIKHIGSNLTDYFDSEEELTPQQQFNEFKLQAKEIGIAQAINSCVGLYAFCEEIYNINEIKI